MSVFRSPTTISAVPFGLSPAPDYTETIECVVTALGDRPKGTSLIVTGDLNTDLGDSESDRRVSEIATAMTEAGVEDMPEHFLPRKRIWGR